MANAAMTSNYLTAAETAKLVRQALKDAFPGVAFSVRSKTYSGGASIDVVWTDGPPHGAVERVAKRFEGTNFDSMLDLATHKPMADGRKTLCDYVFCKRRYSVPLAQQVADGVADAYRLPRITVRADRGNGDADWSDARTIWLPNSILALSDLIYRELLIRSA